MLYLGSLDTLLGRVWRLTVLLDLVMAELPGLDRDCCLIKCQSQECGHIKSHVR